MHFFCKPINDSVYSCVFFFLTGLHFFHLVVGLLLLSLLSWSCSFSFLYFYINILILPFIYSSIPKTSAAILWRINSPKIHDSRQHKIEMSFVTLRPCLWSFYYPISSLSPTVDSWSRPCWRNKSDIKRHMAKDTKWRFQRRERHEDTTRIES